MKQITDERQEYEIYRIEHVALWTVFWLLVASIPVQLLLFREPVMILGECICVLIVSVFILISFVNRGLWGNYTTPTWKTHLLSGVLTAVIGTSVVAIPLLGKDSFLVSILLSFVVLFPVAFALSYALGVIIKKREKILADETDDPR